MHTFLFFYECKTNEIILKTNDQVHDDEVIDLKWESIQKICENDLGDLKKEIFQEVDSN